jgi:hypothetical protein
MVPALASYGDLQNETGLPGQNSPTPSEKVFVRHFIVKIDPNLLTSFPPGTGPYFDPSCGVTYTGPGGQTGFEGQAIAGYAKPDNRPSPPANGWLVRLPPSGPIYTSNIVLIP